MQSLDELPSLAPLLPELDALEAPRREPRPPAAADGHGDGVRLQKVLAEAGVGTPARLRAADLRRAGAGRRRGRVPARQPGRSAPRWSRWTASGSTSAPDLVYLALNKPRGVLSAMSDARGRPDVADLVADRPERLFHVGRLDADSEGLLLLTNDGELAHRLTHPAFGVSKTYLATVPGPVPRGLGRRLLGGVLLPDGPVRADAFRLVQQQATGP